MRLQCASLLPCPVEQIRSELTHPALLQHVAWPMLEFVPVEPAGFGDIWAPGKYRAQLKIAGRLSIGEHTLNPQPLPPGSDPLVWHDAGYSDLIKVWDHKIELSNVSGMTRYRDVVEIRAGLLTVPAWVFAQLFYRHRQRRLNRLAGSAFDYDRAR